MSLSSIASPAPIFPQYNAARLSRTDAVSHNNGSYDVMAFATVDFDYGGLTDGNKNRLTARIAGMYQLSGFMGWAAAANGARRAYLRVNASYSFLGDDHAPNGSYSTYLTMSGLVHLNVSDYVELLVYQSSGGALNTDAGASYPNYLAMQLVRPDNALSPLLVQLDFTKMSNSQTVTVTNAANNYITFDTVVKQLGNVLWVVGNPSRFTAVVAGVYHVEAEIISDQGTTGLREALFLVNRTTTWADVRFLSNANRIYHHISADIYMNVGEYVEFCIYQSQGNSVTYLANGWMSVRLVRPS